jgi:hypothetical protein
MINPNLVGLRFRSAKRAQSIRRDGLEKASSELAAGGLEAIALAR